MGSGDARIEELKEFARALGILAVDRFADEEQLIRTIQLESGHEDCFNSPLGCATPHGSCYWKAECASFQGRFGA